MATVTKSRGRKPLAEGQIAYSWSNMGEDGERYNIAVRGDQHWFKTSMTKKEAISFAAWVAGHITDKGTYCLDKRTQAERLRALADELEGK